MSNNLINLGALNGLLGFLNNSASSANTAPSAPVAPTWKRIEGVTQGCYALEITDTEYHTQCEGVSSSTLKKILRSPAHYKAYISATNKDSGPRKFGRAVHALLLEPQKFDAHFAIWSEGRRAGWKFEDFADKHPGKTILTEDEFHRATEAALALRNNKQFPFGAWLDGLKAKDGFAEVPAALTEFSIFWTDEETGLLCKARVDAHGVIPNPLAMDVKTTDDSRTDIYMRQFFQLDYDLQAAHYRAALKAFYGFEFPFLHAVVEDQEPHAANIIGLEPEVIANGEAKRRDALNLLKKCRDADEWPTYGYDKVEVLSMPFYKLYTPKTAFQ